MSSWVKKFGNTFRGIRVAVRTENSFLVHLPVAAAVVVAAALLGVSLVEWCILLGAIAAVLTTELLNTALERMAKAVDRNPNEHLRDALDMAGAAVLVYSLGAVVIGAMILGNRLYALVAG